MRHFLAVARELGATPQEIEETLAIAMVVGGSKVKLLGRDCLAPLSPEPVSAVQPGPASAPPGGS